MAQFNYNITLTSKNETFSEDEEKFIEKCKAALQKAISEVIPFSNTVVIGTVCGLVGEAAPAEDSPVIVSDEELTVEEQEVVEKFEEGSEEIEEPVDLSNAVKGKVVETEEGPVVVEVDSLTTSESEVKPPTAEKKKAPKKKKASDRDSVQ